MQTNDQVVDPKDVKAIEEELEAKMLRILAQPDVAIPDEEIAVDGSFSEEQRETLQTLLEAEMPTPEEIEQQIKIQAHNAEIQQKRDERQAKKQARRKIIGKRRRRR